ncbi:aspartate/glutamate racemase family protein [Pseudonocardia sp. GCM10023141]|uniref:aspartate/glutamate racemase family protein n=1 Tax=Pseudonocardia sp. GCM10023141 TaxID=3252653 RepID=UPI0036069A6C
MQTIGLIGGMSWESSAEYYRLANEAVARELGGLHSARLLMTSVDFADIEELQRDGDWDRTGVLLAAEARSLQDGGADMVLLCTNTMHIVADAVAAAVDIPLLHIIDVTAAAVLAAGHRRVGLLATGFTMEMPFYRDRMAAHGIDVVVPDTDDRALVHRVIYDELCRGIVLDSSRAAYRDVIGRLVAAGVEGVVLGCTEIELLITQADSAVPVFPTTRLHVEAAVARALG